MSEHIETIREALDLGLQAWRTTDTRSRFHDAFAALDALDALAAEVEQDTALVQKLMQEKSEALSRAQAAETEVERLRSLLERALPLTHASYVKREGAVVQPLRDDMKDALAQTKDEATGSGKTTSVNQDYFNPRAPWPAQTKDEA